ncbi:uncharacterized protein [Panulirus ornatus]|uniref:uncharacterized protein isoform X1 n=1 Tax=Panulirus ornatus TaxID=150431 RepID=UPI003A85F754
MTERPSLVVDVSVNWPVFSTTGVRPIAITSLLIPVKLYLDTIFPPKPGQHYPTQPVPSSSSSYHYYYDDYHRESLYYPENNLYHYPQQYPASSGRQGYPKKEGSAAWVEVGRPGRGQQGGSASVLTTPTLVFGNARSVGEDQVGVFRQLEASLKTVGLDGRACLLKLVCEAQKPKLLKLNLLGHLLAALLTPRDETLLAEYAEAAALGRQDSCAPHYPSCPISIFNIFNFAKTNKTSKTTTASKIPTTSDVKNPEDSQV